MKLSTVEVAGRIPPTGVKVATIHSYLSRARAARAKGDEKPWHIPEPEYDRGHPVWDEAVIDAWLRARLQGPGPRGRRGPASDRAT